MVAGHTPAGMVRSAAVARRPSSDAQQADDRAPRALIQQHVRRRIGELEVEGRRKDAAAPTMSVGGRRRWTVIQSGVDGKSNTVRPGWSRSRRIEHLRLRFAARDRIGSEDPWTLALYFSSSSRARPRPRLDRSPANPSATPVTQVAIPRARGGAEAAPPNAKLGHLRLFFF